MILVISNLMFLTDAYIFDYYLAAKERNMSLEDLMRLPQGSSRRNKHDDTTAVVLFF